MHKFLIMTNFQTIIRTWYQKNGRHLPWRETSDPYKIWISEIILQQTQVKQGLNYYQRFIRKFPDVQALANASENQVMQQWQGLGYYSRARNLHLAAKTIVTEYNGLFPQTYKKILKLKGIGTYTAAAIASIAFGEPRPVVDGNVYRVLSRLFMADIPIDRTEGKKYFEKKASELLDQKSPGTHNQAMMELGALICRPASPICRECPVSAFCKAAAHGKQTLFPVRSKKISRKKRWLHFLIISQNGQTVVQKRTENDIWKGLYQFPLIETKKYSSSDTIRKRLKKTLPDGIRIEKTHQEKHLLTHQELNATFYNLVCPKNVEIPQTFNQLENELIKNENILGLPFPQLIQKNLLKLIKP